MKPMPEEGQNMGDLDSQLLWTRWYVEYTGKTSWLVQKILKVAKYLQQLGFIETILRDQKEYSIGKIYLQMIGPMERVEQRSMVWGNYGAPKWLFILYLAVNKRLATKARLAK